MRSEVLEGQQQQIAGLQLEHRHEQSGQLAGAAQLLGGISAL
jgi:hypothetical protein